MKNSHNGEVDLEKLLRRGSASSGSCYSLERRTKKQISPKEHKNAATLPKDRHGFELIALPNLNGPSTSTINTGSQHSRLLDCEEVEGKLLAYTFQRKSETNDQEISAKQENPTVATFKVPESAKDRTKSEPHGVLEDQIDCFKEMNHDKEATAPLETLTEATVDDSTPSAEIQDKAEDKNELTPLGILEDQTDCSQESDRNKEALTKATVDDSIPPAEIQDNAEKKNEPTPLGLLEYQTNCSQESDRNKEALTKATVDDSIPSAEIQDKAEDKNELTPLGILEDQTDCSQESDRNKEALAKATVDDSIPPAEIQDKAEDKNEPTPLGLLEDQTNCSQESDRNKEALTKATVDDNIPPAEIQDKAEDKNEPTPLGLLEDQTDCSQESDRDKEALTKATVDDSIPPAEIQDKAEDKNEPTPLGILEDQTDCSQESDRNKEALTKATVDDSIPPAEIQDKAEDKNEPTPLGLLEDQTNCSQESDRNKEALTKATVDDNIPLAEIQDKAEDKNELTPLGLLEDQTDCSQESDRDKEALTKATVDDSIPSAEIQDKAEDKNEPTPLGLLEDQTNCSQESDRNKEALTKATVDDNIPPAEIQDKAEDKNEPTPLGLLEDQTNCSQESDRNKEALAKATVDDSIPPAEIQDKAEDKNEPTPLGLLEDQTNCSQESDRNKEALTKATVDDNIPPAEIQDKAEDKNEPTPLGLLEDQTDCSQESDRDKEALTKATVDDSIPPAEIQDKAEDKNEPTPLGILEDQTDCSQESDRNKEALTKATVDDSIPPAEIQDKAEDKNEPTPLGLLEDQTNCSQESDRNKEALTKATVDDNIPLAEIQDKAEDKNEPSPLGILEDQTDCSQESDRNKEALTKATVDDSIPSAETQDNTKDKNELTSLGILEDLANCSQENNQDKEAAVAKATPAEATVDDSIPSAVIREDSIQKANTDPLGIFSDRIDADKRCEPVVEVALLRERPTESTANDNNPFADIWKDSVPKTDPCPLGIFEDRIDADKRSEPEKEFTVGIEQPTEGINDYTAWEGGCEVARHTGEVGSQAAIPGEGHTIVCDLSEMHTSAKCIATQVRIIAIADRPSVLNNENGTTIDVDRPNKDGAVSTHCSNHSIQTDDSVIIVADGCFIAKEDRSDSLIEIEKVTGHFHTDYFEESNIYVIADNNTDEIDEKAGLSTATEDAIEGASSNIATSGCSFMQGKKKLQQHSAEKFEVDSDAPMLPALKSLDEQGEPHSSHTAMVKQNERKSPTASGSPSGPVSTPDNGESVDVQHGLEERDHGNKASRDFLGVDLISEKNPLQKSSDNMQIKELLEKENSELKELHIPCEENERKDSKQYVKVTKNLTSDTQEQPSKETDAQVISNSHGKEEHHNDVGIVEKNSGELETLGDGLADGECQVFRASVENMVHQQEEQKNDCPNDLVKVAQGTHLEQVVFKDDEAEITHCPTKVVNVEVTMCGNVAHGTNMKDAGVGMIAAVSIAGTCQNKMKENSRKEIVAKNSKRTEDRQQQSYEDQDGLCPREAIVKAQSEGCLQSNEADSASRGCNELESMKEVNLVENAEENLSACSSSSDHYPSNDQKEGPLACLCACEDCGNFLSMEVECYTEKEKVLAYLTRNNSDQPCSVYDLSTAVNSSYPISSTVSMEHVEDEWTVRAYYSDDEFEQDTKDGKYGNVDADDAETVIDAEMFQDGEDVWNDVKSAPLGDC